LDSAERSVAVGLNLGGVDLAARQSNLVAENVQQDVERMTIDGLEVLAGDRIDSVISRYVDHLCQLRADVETREVIAVVAVCVRNRVHDPGEDGAEVHLCQADEADLHRYLLALKCEAWEVRCDQSSLVLNSEAPRGLIGSSFDGLNGLIDIIHRLNPIVLPAHSCWVVGEDAGVASNGDEKY
jgi:hypothetical protein